MFTPLDRLFSIIAGWFDQYLILPILYHAGWMQWEELSFDWALVCVYGIFALIMTYAVCWPLELWRPVERWESRRAVFTDIGYTILTRIGVVPIFSFIVFYQVQVWANGWIVERGFIPPMLETLIPQLAGHQFITFFAYALILDFADYWRHRVLHIFDTAYTIHALHHAQRQMSFWSDDRNHMLENLMQGIWFGVVGLLIGVPPLQFPLLLMFTQFVESLSHANVRLSFGWLGDRILISPLFHRIHHGVNAAGITSCNFGAVFPYWDMLFGTADFSKKYPRTGDDTAPEAMATGGFVAQQWSGVVLLLNQFRRKRRQAAE